MKHALAALVMGLSLVMGSGIVWAADKGLEAAQKGDFATALREWRPLAEQGDAGAQYNLGVMYRQGQGVPQDDKTAVKWYRLAAEQGHAEAQETVKIVQEKIEDESGKRLLQDFVYGNDIRKLEDLTNSVANLCKNDIKCSFDKVWSYLDISKDDRLSLAEIARMQRNIVKFAAVGENKHAIKTEEVAAINLASIILLPITASSILHSFDYNNDGFLSKNEVLGDTDFSKLVGVDVDKLATGLDFQTLGEKLINSMDLIPFLK
jgi:hypothetical protein